MRVLEGALAQLTLVWSQLDYRPKPGANGRIAMTELPSFRDATTAVKTILTKRRTEYDDVPAEQIPVAEPDGRTWPWATTSLTMRARAWPTAQNRPRLVSQELPQPAHESCQPQHLISTVYDTYARMRGGGDWVVCPVPFLSKGTAVTADVWYPKRFVGSGWASR
jgi:hypothetical protein